MQLPPAAPEKFRLKFKQASCYLSDLLYAEKRNDNAVNLAKTYAKVKF